MNRLQQLEQDCLNEGQEWIRRRLQERLQQEADAVPGVCPRSGQPLRDVRRRPMVLRTVAGEVHLQVTYGRSPTNRAWLSPVRIAWGREAGERVNPEYR